MKIQIEFDIDNAAFDDDFNQEIEFVLNTCKDLCEQKSEEPLSLLYTLRDSNGNKIGTIKSVL